jgi:uncharacterized caspase-like protein
VIAVPESPQIDAPPPSRRALHFALVVGIDRYPGFTDLARAREDAEAFARWLQDPDGGGLPEDNVFTLLSGAASTLRDARPVADEIDSVLKEINRALEARLDESGKTRQEARLYVYFAGHGVAPPEGRGALMMANAEPEIEGRSYDLWRILAWYEKHGRFGELIGLLDCCRELDEMLPPAAGPALTKTHAASGRTAIVAGYACAMGAEAFEPTEASTLPDEGRRGYFTTALLDGLHGAAAHPTEGIVKSGYLDAYIRRSVERRSGRRQTSDVSGPGDVILVESARRPVRKIEIILQSDFEGEVRLLTSWGEAFTRWRWPGWGTWVVPLGDGWYQVEPIPRRLPSPFVNDGVFEVQEDGIVQL